MVVERVFLIKFLKIKNLSTLQEAGSKENSNGFKMFVVLSTLLNSFQFEMLLSALICFKDSFKICLGFAMKFAEA